MKMSLQCLSPGRLKAKYLIVTLLYMLAASSLYAQDKQVYIPLSGEAADRLAIKELIDAYSHDADRRLTQQQADLFAVDGVIEVYHSEPGKNKPDAIIAGKKALFEGFSTLKKYDVTMHFNGQSDFTINGDTARGETYCLAHHIWMVKGKRQLAVAAIRYYDTIVRVNGQWLFAKRKLIFDWIDHRKSPLATL